MYINDKKDRNRIAKIYSLVFICPVKLKPRKKNSINIYSRVYTYGSDRDKNGENDSFFFFCGFKKK